MISGLLVISVPGPIDSVCRIEAQIDGILNQTRTRVDCSGAILRSGLQEDLQRLIRAACSEGSKVTSIELQVLFLTSSVGTFHFGLTILYCLHFALNETVL